MNRVNLKSFCIICKKNIRIITLTVVLIFISVFSEAIFNFNDTEYIITITDKDRINVKTLSKYLVFADDESGNALVFENTDCFIRWKFNSSDIQGELKEGHTYKITVVGYRVPFFSWYQNIIKVEELLAD